MNRNCFYCLNSITTRSYHEAGVLRVDRDAIENGWAGYYNNWSETVHRAIGASDEQLLTLEPRKKGESYSPDAYFHKNYTMLYNYYVNEGKPDEIWVVDPSKCEDYDEKKKSSKMYVYWSNLYGLTSQPKIQLQQWQQENLAAIWIRPDDVELVKEAQTQRRKDQLIAKMQARKNKISRRE